MAALAFLYLPRKTFISQATVRARDRVPFQHKRFILDNNDPCDYLTKTMELVISRKRGTRVKTLNISLPRSSKIIPLGLSCIVTWNGFFFFFKQEG